MPNLYGKGRTRWSARAILLRLLPDERKHMLQQWQLIWSAPGGAHVVEGIAQAPERLGLVWPLTYLTRVQSRRPQHGARRFYDYLLNFGPRNQIHEIGRA